MLFWVNMLDWCLVRVMRFVVVFWSSLCYVMVEKFVIILIL